MEPLAEVDCVYWDAYPAMSRRISTRQVVPLIRQAGQRRPMESLPMPELSNKGRVAQRAMEARVSLHPRHT